MIGQAYFVRKKPYLNAGHPPLKWQTILAPAARFLHMVMYIKHADKEGLPMPQWLCNQLKSAYLRKDRRQIKLLNECWFFYRGSAEERAR